jgi:hypothetical protein
LLGFGLWRYPAVSLTLESLLIAAGFLLYFRSIVAGTEGKRKVLAIAAGGFMGMLLILSLLTDALGVA